MKQINLLPKSEQKDLKLQFFSEQLVRFWIWVLISLALFLGLTYLAKEYLNSQIADTDGLIALERQILRSDDNEQLKLEVEGLNNQMLSIRSLSNQHYYWSEALIELARLLSPDVHLDLVVMDRASGKVQIQGTAGNRENVLKFWADVHKSEYFKNIDFPLANLNRATQDPFTFNFFINAEKLRTP